MTKSKSFSINGQFYCANVNLTLFDVINYFSFNDSLLVLEYNNWICNKKKWKEIVIEDQDKIEIVTIVGGG